MKSKDLISITDLNPEEIQVLISEAIRLKADPWSNMLDRKILALLFEKPSLRTRVSFEVAMRHLGGYTIYLSPAEVGLGKRESIPDVARVLCRYASVISARTYSHTTVQILAQYADVPVINALSDVEHPCQALGDLLTITEKKGDFKGLTVAYIGDGNNVANSLMLASTQVGMNFRIASPRGYEITPALWETGQDYARESGAELVTTNSPQEAVVGADIIYTDVWTSMGQEGESELRRRVFKDYQVTLELLRLAKEDVIFMHPLPAHRGEEVTDEVMESTYAVVFEQAENRMHAQKALLAEMLGGLDIFFSRHK